MAKKKTEFKAPYIGIETIEDIPVFYNRKGDYSVIIKCENPVMQYAADMDAYYDFHNLFANILKILGSGYIIQKQDILCKKKFKMPKTTKDDYLSHRYFSHFEGRIYTDISTNLIITGQIEKSKFLTFDRKVFDTFLRNIIKILGLFSNKGLKAQLLSENEIEYYLKRFLSINFNKPVVSLKNIRTRDMDIKIGDTTVQSISLVDIDEVNFPSTIKPYKEVNIGLKFPVDLFAFLHETPAIETLIYNQVISIPDQRSESNKLEAKKKRHSGMPDPANDLCVEDIEKVQADIAREGQMLVYAHNNIILCGEGELNKAINYVENALFDCGIIINKQCYNQLELFECSLPGNASNLKDYDKFLTTSDAAICLLFKEKLQSTEESAFLTYFTDRQGLPVGIDISGKEGEKKYTNNSNFFVLGPSGSGKSFYVNSIIRQWVLENTDIVLVDTGHSYSGMCEYYNGKYITYSKENPISMNPFRITKEEYNVEKKNFLKSLIFLIWKGTTGNVSKEEEEVMDIAIEKYYSFYFEPFNGYSEEEKETIRESLMLEYKVSGENFESEIEKEERKALTEKVEKLQQLVEKGEGGEKTNAENAIQNILIEKGFTRNELHNSDARLLTIIERRIQKKEETLRSIRVESLSFNTFYEFTLQIIPLICRENNIDFDMARYKFLLKKFYKGGQLEKTLNEDFDNSLFEEPFIVFEIDAIKDDPELFPIVTLIIMDVFIQKMRLKKNRKALIIEEAWKAIASPMMANYILYLYKTVRKFWGMAMVVTQELEDIISNPVVKKSIINNSDIICLLDQSKFKDKYQEIANLLSLSEVQQKQIFTINQLNNKENRNRFNEVFIKRGNFGNVFGVEVSLHEYFTFTTERIEKDAIGYYQMIYGDFKAALDNFISDLKSSKLKQGDWVRQVSTVLGNYSKQHELNKLFNDGTVNKESLCSHIKSKYRELIKNI